MASEKQIAANRGNAMKSTGPKTAAGRAKSSRNALRHGLSLPMCLHGEARVAAELLAWTIAKETMGEEQPEAAREDQLEAARAVVLAQLELKRIREVKLAATPIGLQPAPEALGELCAIGRYERLALSRRKAAMRRLREMECDLK